MKAVNPYLNFDGNTEEAFAFYKSVFGGAFLGVTRFRDMPGMDEMPEEARDKIMHIALPIGKDTTLMASDTLESMGKTVTFGNNFYISIEADSAEEAERLFNDLSAGGQVEMPLQKTEWAEAFGMCADKFGVQWMLNYTGNVDFSDSQED